VEGYGAKNCAGSDFSYCSPPEMGEEMKVHMSPAATALAIYTLVVIGRIPDFFPSFRLALLTLAATITLALLLPRAKGPKLLQSSEVHAALTLFVFAALTIPLSVWPGGSFDHIIDMHSKVVLFFLLLIHCVRSLSEAASIVWGALGANLVLAISALFSSPQGRVYVTGTYDPNDIASIMACTMPLATFLSIESRGLARYLAATIAILAVLIIILTESRGGFITLAVIGIILLFRVPSRSLLLRVVFILSSLLLFGAFASESYWQRMATIWGGSEPEGTLTEYDRGGIYEARWTLWIAGLHLMLQNPLTGVGAGAYEIAEGVSHSGLGKWSTAHNSFIQVGAELGLPGLILFIFLLYSAIRNCRMVIGRARHDSLLNPYLWLANGLEISLYGYIIAGFSLSHGYSWLLYFLLGMSVVLKYLTAAIGSPELLLIRAVES
jgi:O-antigen ligase